MKTLAIAIALIAFSASAVDLLERDPRANDPERNSLSEVVLLLQEVEKVGVTVIVEDGAEPIHLCHGEGAPLAFFAVPEKDTPLLVLCSSLTTSDVLGYITVHEVAHIMQWCKGGRPENPWEGKPLLDGVTQSAVDFASRPGYTKKMFPLEVDAYTFADVTSVRGARKTLEAICK